ncbi:MAG: hypothetical protein HY372_00845, partial [Candidatus Andersenbacteria bacterium]|nr:hypothetical protein [Candidatus Andersenbacteria bacterium]
LLASGRSALHWDLVANGWQRYRHWLVVPRYLSRCVLNAVTRDAFPVQLPQRGDGVLLYHQFGWPQRYRPGAGLIIEDIAHSFYAASEHGRRDWQGAAIFSLPKFFAMGGMAGGLVLSDSKLAQRVRERAAAADATVADADRAWARQIIREAFRNQMAVRQEQLLESAYEFIGSLGRPQMDDLVGFPRSAAELVQVGRARKERAEYVRGYFGTAAWPAGFWPADEVVPFAVPYFPRRRSTLSLAAAALGEQGVTVGVYHIDVRRSMARPQYQRAFLLPIHQEVPLSALARVCEIIAYYEGRAR